MSDRSTDMTLAFTREALQRLAEPRAALEDAREWTEYVGAVAAEPNGALSVATERRIRLDFFSGTRPPAEALYGVASTYRTERYVLVGVDGQEELGTDRSWTFQHVEDAADRAGWELREPGGVEGGSVRRVLGRVRDAIGR